MVRSPTDALRSVIGTASGDAAALFALALVLRAEWWGDVGTTVARDATRYVAWCGDLSISTLFGSRALVYSGYWLPYCGWLRATGEFVAGWVGIQVLLSALVPVVVYATARQHAGRAAGLVAGGAMAVQWEVYRWAVRPQSEFAMTVAVALALWRLGRYHLDATRRNRLLAFASLGLVATVRPNGLPIVAAYVLYDCLPDASGRRLNVFFRQKVNLAIAGTLAALVAYRLRFGWARGSVLVHWREGTVVTPDRVVYEYPAEPASGVVSFFLANAEHALALVTLRGLWFFSPVMPGWSTSHAVKAAVTLTPLLVGAALGIGRAWRDDRALLALWGTPLAAILVTAMGTWVAGWRNFLGAAVVVYALFTGYYVSRTAWPDRVRSVAESLSVAPTNSRDDRS